MLSGKKIAVVVLLVVGLNVALFFRKERGPVEEGSLTFRDPVERRLGAASSTLAAERRAVRLPTASTGLVLDTAGGDVPTDYDRSFNPAGALLRPLEDRSSQEHKPADVSGGEREPGTHLIADGDTLSKLAEKYLGSSERFAELYEYNRAMLASPDLLPIGKTLKIPPREKPAGDAPQAGDATAAGGDAEQLPLVPIPKAALNATAEEE